MIKKICLYASSFLLGAFLCVCLSIMINPNIGSGAALIFINAFTLKIFYDFLNSSLITRGIPNIRKKECTTLCEWIESKNKGYVQLEKRILKYKPKKNFLDNLSLIRKELVKLGKTEVKLLRAHLNVLDKNDSYNEFVVKVLTTIGTGLFLWFVKDITLKEIQSSMFNGIVNAFSWFIFFMIAFISLVNHNLKYSYKTRILIELIDTIEDDDYKEVY